MEKYYIDLYGAEGNQPSNDYIFLKRKTKKLKNIIIISQKYIEEIVPVRTHLPLKIKHLKKAKFIRTRLHIQKIVLHPKYLMQFL